MKEKKYIPKEDECNGCLLVRSMNQFNYYRHNDQKILNCELQYHDCPCKKCIVKLMCNIENYSTCPDTSIANLLFCNNEYWTNIRNNLLGVDVG